MALCILPPRRYNGHFAAPTIAAIPAMATAVLAQRHMALIVPGLNREKANVSAGLFCEIKNLLDYFLGGAMASLTALAT